MKQETVVNSEQVKVENGVGKWMAPFMLFVGAIFLMGTSGITFGGYSPSMLIGLLPIYLIGVAAYSRYKAQGRLSRRVLGIAVFAVLPLAYMVAMALGYTVSGLWPLGIIVVGVSFLLLGGGK